jgi:glycosyltransferase involved in cell wall biosynthesis
MLWIVPKWPFPGEDGARIATTNLVKGLLQEGQQLDMLVLADRDDRIDIELAKQESGLQRVLVLRKPRQSTLRFLRLSKAALLSPLCPITMHSLSRGLLGGEIQRLLSGNASGAVEVYRSPGTTTRGELRWDAVVFDSLHSAAPFMKHGTFRRPKHIKRAIYRAHNCETDLWLRKIPWTKSALERVILRQQAALVRRFEQSVVRGCDAVATVSKADAQQLQRYSDHTKVSVTPIGYRIPETCRSEVCQSSLLFLGRLDWYPNVHGLRWFLQEVWPTVVKRRHDLTLRIAGSGDGTWLNKYRSLPNIEVLGRVESVDLLYRQCTLSIVPLFYGSGTRVKAIEASYFACPCLSTTLGVEGLEMSPNKTFLHAETSEQWINTLVSLSAEEATRIGLAARQHVSSNFSIAATTSRFQHLLGEVGHAVSA